MFVRPEVKHGIHLGRVMHASADPLARRGRFGCCGGFILHAGVMIGGAKLSSDNQKNDACNSIHIRMLTHICRLSFPVNFAVAR